MRPQIITATSGQVRWTCHYLAQLDLETRFKKDMKESQPFTSAIDANVLWRVFNNIMQPIRLSLPEFPLDIASAINQSWRNLARKSLPVSMFREAMNVLPARSLVSMYQPVEFATMADCLNNTDIGIIFNSYDFREGCEHVYMNQAAARLTDKLDNNGYFIDSKRPWVTYRPINAQAVEDSLRLYEYGFTSTSEMLDGAYIRDIILSEIPSKNNQVRVIAVARPQADSWLGPNPTSWVEMKDMQTEVSFNGSYFVERERILSQNRANKKTIWLYELPLDEQRGWWEYLLEDPKIFESAVRRGGELMNRL